MNNKYRILIVGSLLLGFVGQVLAGPADFARGRVLDPNDESVVQRVRLPNDVYEWVTRPDLGDLRVFNNAQDEVPYALRRPQMEDEYSPWQSVPLFALPAADVGTGANARVKVEVDGGGAIVAISSPRSAEPAVSSPVAGFLVDLSSLSRAPTELQIDWAGEDAADFVGKLKIEASDDLDLWRTFVTATTIASLFAETHQVTVDRFDLPGKAVRYLRLTQVEGSEQVSLTRVQVRHRQSQLPARQWKSLPAELNEGGYEFSSGGLFPVDRVTLEDADGGKNYLVSADLYSRRGLDQEWRSRGARNFYRTTINGLTAHSDPLAISDRDQFWRVEFDGAGLASPVLRIGWLPDEVVFLKQGGAPYLLAYGQAEFEGMHWPLKQLLRQLLGNGTGDDELIALARVPLAGIGDAQMLGGPDRLLAPAAPIDWQTVVLWAVLVLGVLVVGLFAFRLLKS